MVILRYFSREILLNTGSVSLVLLLVVMSGRFIQILEKTAAGEISIDLLVSMFLWRVPASLELILPLALTLAVLLTLGRASQDAELAVWRASGVSNRRLFVITSIPVLLVTVLVGWLSLVVSPTVARELDRQASLNDRLTAFDSVIPGRFQTDRSGRLIYAAGISPDRESLLEVLIVETNRVAGDLFLTGERARQEFIEGEKFLVVMNGVKHVGRPGALDWEISSFDRYVMRLAAERADRPLPLDTWTTSALWAEGEPAHLAIAMYRASLPIMCLLMLPFAFVMGQSGPRQSRLVWVIPVIVLQFGYVTALSFAEQAVARAVWPPWPGVLWVHGGFLLASLCLLKLGPIARRRGWV